MRIKNRSFKIFSCFIFWYNI